MRQTAPNVSELVGIEVAAKLIASAGGIKELALMPPGNIQVLGK
jgi:RNA processing factor Prp31